MKETTVPSAFGISGASIDAVDAIYAKCVALGMSGQLTAGKDAAILAFISNKVAERENWEKTAREYSVNASFYRDLLVKIGEYFGEEAKRQLDGNVVPDVLVLNIESLVAGMLAQNKLLLEQNSILIGRNHELEQTRKPD